MSSRRLLTIISNSEDKQARCVIIQPQNDKKDLRPVGYWTRSLSYTKRKYDATRRKSLRAVWAIRSLGPYVKGSISIVHIHRQTLTWLLDFKQ